MQNMSTSAAHRPFKSTRSSEILAWIIVLFIVGFSLFFFPAIKAYRFAVWIFLILFSLSAILISFGNWVERKTFLRLDEDGVYFQNGIRKTALLWAEITKVEVFPTGNGDKVLIYGQQSSFSFRTLGELILRGETKGYHGFEKGEQILNTILQHTGLIKTERLTAEHSYYYSRD